MSPLDTASAVFALPLPNSEHKDESCEHKEDGSSEHKGLSSEHKDLGKSADKGFRSEHSGGSSEHKGLAGLNMASSSEHNELSCEHKERGSSEHKGLNSEHSDISGAGSTVPSRRLDEDGCLLSEHLDAPLIDSLDGLAASLRDHLLFISEEARQRLRMQPARMQEVIRLLCKEHYLTLNVLALLLNRSPDALRQQYLNSMVKTRQLKLAFPSKPTHIRQAYTAHFRQQP